MKPHERWWQDNLPTRRDEFAEWLAGSDQTSRRAVADMVDEMVDEDGLVAVCEIGPGTYLDWETLWRLRPHVLYQAVDVTPAIVEDGQGLGLTVRLGSIEAIPLHDRAVSVAYCRHVLEHLPTYKTALLELCRVAHDFAVAVLWRLDTSADADAIYYNTVADVPNTYHNMYSQAAISAFLQRQGIPHRWQQAAADWLLVMDVRR